MKHSQKIEKAYEALTEDQQIHAAEIATTSCTTGYDNDGSTGFDIFQNGVALGEELTPGHEIYYINEGEYDVAYFYIAKNEDEVINWFKQD